ncbi:MAG: hypothetical protein IJT98_03160 [Prevotella sp.]|nr:hypothetical protein [Prevotella sp.]
MKRHLSALCAFLLGTVALTSCLKSENDEVAYSYSDTAITQFTLGTLNRYTHTTSSKTGNDTVVKSTLTGSSYRMTIDHVGCKVYNAYPLPVGTDIKHVVCTISTKNGGAVALKSMTSDSLRWFSTSDSIDFSQPRTFVVYSANLSSIREYTVSLNVSATTGINFAWTLDKTIGQPDTLTGKTLTAYADSVAIVATDSIIGNAGNECYAISYDGHLMRSLNGGLNWENDALDDAEELLPAAGQASCVTWDYAPADNTQCILMVGTPRQGDAKNMRVWRKITGAAGSGQWIYMPFDDTNYFPLTRQEHVALAYYNETVLCTGTDGIMRQSADQGISWRKSSTYAMPSSITGTVIAMATDNQQRIWMLTTTGQLWRGQVSE